MVFEDRVSAYPNRYAMTDEQGNVSHVFLERADEPLVPGTPLNAETLNSLYLYSDTPNYPGSYSRVVDGETEFMNPPTVPSTVCRTVKRYNGYPVYLAVVQIPNLANKGESITYAMNGVTNIVSVSATYYYKENGETKSVNPNPWVELDGVYAITRVVDKNVLEIKSGNTNMDYSKCSAVCVIEATREGE